MESDVFVCSFVICHDLRSQLLQLTHVNMAFLYNIYFLHFDSHTARYNNDYDEM